MAENSNIEWTDHTFNPWIGCTKVSPGCDHCYAETWDARGLQQQESRWGPHASRTRTSAANWRKPLAWNRAAEKAGKRARVFCASLADVFDNHASIRPVWRRDLWALIRATPNLDWMLLTKRPGNIKNMLPHVYSGPEWGDGWPNVWLGTTAENQTEADRRISHLLAVPAAVRFLSCEPLLGPVDLTTIWLRRDGQRMTKLSNSLGDYVQPLRGNFRDSPKIHWIICGGESGPNARPMHPDWARSLRDQCEAAGVAFFFKQWGEWEPTVRSDEIDTRITMPGQNFNLWAWPDGVTKDSWRHGAVSVRVGKKRAGRLLDGREWSQMPGAM